VGAKPKAAYLYAEYKQRILLEAETAAAIPGSVRRLLRAKVCTHPCCPIGGANGPMESAML